MAPVLITLVRRRLDDVPIGDNLTTFLAKAFYLANSPTDRESSGFNERFHGQSPSLS